MGGCKKPSRCGGIINAIAEHPTFEPLLDSAEAAKLLGGIHPKTLMKKAREGAIPSYVVFGKRLFRASELDSWLSPCSTSFSQSARLEPA